MTPIPVSPRPLGLADAAAAGEFAFGVLCILMAGLCYECGAVGRPEFPCSDSVVVVHLDTPSQRGCHNSGAVMEPIAIDHPGSLAYLCRCPTPAVEETP